MSELVTAPVRLQPVFRGDLIPALLKQETRWAPWRAKWNAKRGGQGKWDKIPCYPIAPFYGISTAKPDRWSSFDAAMVGLVASPDRFAGLGYCMTGAHGVVGIDLDGCVDSAGEIAPWAREIVDAIGTYTERSPSGLGLRLFVRGEILNDWTNNDIGIEVYAGHEPRFLTVTGDHVAGTPLQIAQEPHGVLEQLEQRYARERSAPGANVITLAMPDLVDELLLPDLGTLGLPYAAMDFLSEGASRGDRSREIFAAAVALHQAGLDAASVFSVLAQNPHALEAALAHRRQDHDRALRYLWVEHAQKAQGRSSNKVATADDFEVVGEATPVPGVSTAQIKVRPRFAFTTAEEFLDPSHPPARWLVKNLLPETGLGMVYGPSKSGKTFFVLDLAMSVARGTGWRDRRVQQGAVAYVCAEGGAGFRKRGRAYLEHHGVDRAGLPFYMLTDAPNLLEKSDVKDLMSALLQIKGLRLVIVDTLAQTTPGANENSGEDMGRAMAHCNRIAALTGAMVLLVGHTGKDEDKGHRGWSGMPAAFDVSVQIQRSGDLRQATIDKLKDGEGEGDEFPFHLHSVVLGEDEAGELVTSCVALPGNASGARKALPKLKPEEQQMVDTARGLLDLSDSLTYTELISAAIAQTPKPTGRTDNRRRDAERCFKQLEKKGVLRDVDDSVAFVQ